MARAARTPDNEDWTAPAAEGGGAQLVVSYKLQLCVRGHARFNRLIARLFIIRWKSINNQIVTANDDNPCMLSSSTSLVLCNLHKPVQYRS